MAEKCSHQDSYLLSSLGNFQLHVCNRCSIVFSGQLENFKPEKAYQGYYNQHSARFRFGIEYLVRLFRFLRAARIHFIDPTAKSILDVGSGRGFTLYYLRKFFGFEKMVGTQIERNSYLFSKNKLGLKIYNKDLRKINFKNEKFDFVTLWHVLEHIEDPQEYIKQIARIMKKGGHLLIEVPNFNAWTRFITGKYWLSLDPEYHLYFFNKQNLLSLLKRSRLKIKSFRSFSLEYSTFTSIQSLVSRVTGTNHILFKWVQKGDTNLQVIGHIFLFLLFSPFCFLINLALYKSAFGEVLFVIAKK